jgi:hypothetical protein
MPYFENELRKRRQHVSTVLQTLPMPSALGVVNGAPLLLWLSACVRQLSASMTAVRY